MDESSSPEPLYDAVAGSDGIPQADLTANGAMLGGNPSAAFGTGSGSSSIFSGISNPLASVPTWAWIILGVVVILKVVK